MPHESLLVRILDIHQLCLQSLMMKGDILLKEKKEVDALLCFLSCLSIDPSTTKPMQHAREVRILWVICINNYDITMGTLTCCSDLSSITF